MYKIFFVAIGCIFLCKHPFFTETSPNNVRQCLTKKEQEKLPFLIALSLKEMVAENTLETFIKGLKIAEQEKVSNYQKSPEIEAYHAYKRKLILYPKIVKNEEISARYLRKKQEEEGVVPLIHDKIYYKILKQGKGIENNKMNKVKINFTIKDSEDNPLAGNYVLSGPVSCTLSELIPGMAHAMLGMRLHELREIYIHPEFAYGVFSDFGQGKAFSIQVELVECEATDTIFYPYPISVDLVELVERLCPSKTDNISLQGLQEEYIFFCGKSAWSFYKQKLSQLHLNDILSFLQEKDAFAVLSAEDRETLYKLQWLIYHDQNNFNNTKENTAL